MSADFETFWATTGARYNAADPKDRARHAYTAGQANSTTTPPEQDFWLDRMTDSTKEDKQP